MSRSIGALVIVVSFACTVSGQRQPVHTNGPIVIEPDTKIIVTGKGCAPGGKVTARTTSMHGSANEFETFQADRHGRFRRQVKVPFAGEDEGAGVIVDCVDPSGANIDVFQVAIQYRCDPHSTSPACLHTPRGKGR